MLERDLPQKPDVYKQLLDQGTISPETYNKFVPQTSPTATPIELTDAITAAPGVVGDMIKTSHPFMSGAVDIGQGLAEGAINTISGLAPNIKGAQAESVLMPEGGGVTTPEQLQLMNDNKSQVPQVSQPQGAGMGAGLMSALNAQKSAVMEGAKVGAEQASKEAAYMQTMADESEKMRASEMEREKQRQDKLNQYQSLLNNKMMEIESKPATISEKFANAGLGQKIMMGLGLFLGAAPNSSGQNRAVTVLQQEIDNDIKASRADLENKQSIYKDMKDTFGDERQAEAATRLAYLNNAQLRLNQLASQYKSPQIMANAKLLTSKIDEEKAKYAVQFQQASLQNPALQAADDITKKIMAYPKEMQKELLEAREVYDATEKAFSDIDSIYDGFDVGLMAKVPYTEAEAKLTTEHAKIESAIRATMKGQGTIQESEITRLVNPFLPQPTDTAARLAIKKAQLKSLLENKNAGQISRLKNTGLLPQKKKFNLTPNF